MRIELNLNAGQHELLMLLAADDRKARSLQSFCSEIFSDALVRKAAEYPAGRRQKAVETLVAAGNAKQRKP